MQRVRHQISKAPCMVPWQHIWAPGLIMFIPLSKRLVFKDILRLIFFLVVFVFFFKHGGNWNEMACMITVEPLPRLYLLAFLVSGTCLVLSRPQKCFFNWSEYKCTLSLVTVFWDDQSSDTLILGLEFISWNPKVTMLRLDPWRWSLGFILEIKPPHPPAELAQASTEL